MARNPAQDTKRKALLGDGRSFIMAPPSPATRRGREERVVTADDHAGAYCAEAGAGRHILVRHSTSIRNRVRKNLACVGNFVHTRGMNLRRFI